MSSTMTIAGETVYYRGDKELAYSDMVLVTGTRRSTPYGIWLADMAGRIVAECGLTLATCAAIGCNVVAARSAINAGGKVVVFSGRGLDEPYPHSSSDVFDAADLIMGYEPDGTPPRPHAFQRRNELIGKLADVAIVCEAKVPSGVWDMAHKVLDNGGDVLAFPGSICDATCRGTNEMIAAGDAHIVISESLLKDMLNRLF